MEDATFAASVGTGGEAVGVAGGTVGVSTAANRDSSSVNAFADQATLNATTGEIGILAQTQDTVSSNLALSTAIAIAIGAGVGGATSISDISPDVEAYLGFGATASAGGNIGINADAANAAAAQTSGAGYGPIAIGASVSHAASIGSTNAYINGTILASASVSVTATAADSASTSAAAVAGGLIDVVQGGVATSTVSPDVGATAPGNIHSSGAVYVSALVTPSASADVLGVSAAEFTGVGGSVAIATASPSVTATVGARPAGC